MAEVDGSNDPVVADGPHVVALVRRRRVCKVVSVAGLALACASLGMLADASSEDAYYGLWNALLAVGAAILLGALIAARVATGSSDRPEAALARAMRPMFGLGPAETKHDRGDGRGRLLARWLGRPLYFGFTFVIAATIVAGGCALLADHTSESYDAAHARGGHVVTIGKDAHISRTERRVRVYHPNDANHPGRRKPQYTYYLATPYGEAVASGDDGKPADGEQWTVVHKADGMPVAYQVGGWAWLVSLVILVAIAVAALAGICYLAWRLARTLRRSRDAVPMLDNLGYGESINLRAGERPYRVVRAAATS